MKKAEPAIHPRRKFLQFEEALDAPDDHKGVEQPDLPPPVTQKEPIRTSTEVEVQIATADERDGDEAQREEDVVADGPLAEVEVQDRLDNQNEEGAGQVGAEEREVGGHFHLPLGSIQEPRIQGQAVITLVPHVDEGLAPPPLRERQNEPHGGVSPLRLWDAVTCHRPGEERAPLRQMSFQSPLRGGVQAKGEGCNIVGFFFLQPQFEPIRPADSWSGIIE